MARVDELLREQGNPAERVELYRAALERETDPKRRRELLHAIGGIEREDLLIFLVREIVASGLIIGFGIGQQPFYFLNLGQEFRAHRAATDCLGGGGRNARAGDADAAVAEISEQLGRGPAIGTVAVVQNLAQNRFRFRSFAFGDALLGQFHTGVAKTLDRFIVQIAGSDGIREHIDGSAKFLVGDGEIIVRHRAFSARDRLAALWDGGLAARHFALCDALHRFLSDRGLGEDRLTERHLEHANHAGHEYSADNGSFSHRSR